jgi:urease accessory protein
MLCRFRDDGGEWVVSVASLQTQAETFAANRARGDIVLTVAHEHGRTRRKHVKESGSLRARFPNVTGSELEAVVVNTAGGIAGGDCFSLDISAGEGADLLVSGAAAEKIYRAIGADTEISVKLDVAAGAKLRWMPQETILFDRARLTRSIDIDLAADASVLVVEALVFGRAAMGETVREGLLADHWRLRRDGKLVFAENFRLEGEIANTLARPAIANGGAAIATILVSPADETLIERLRAIECSGEVGISAWNGFALARFCAADGAALRRDIVAMLAALDRGTLPRLWLN